MIVRLLLLFAILGLATASGAMQLQKMSNFYSIRKRSPLPNHQVYDLLRPLLDGHAKVYLAVDGASQEKRQKQFGAQFALAPCLVISPGKSAGRGLPQFLSGMPFVTNINSPETRELIETQLRQSAQKRGRKVQVHKITDEVFLYVLEDKQ